MDQMKSTFCSVLTLSILAIFITPSAFAEGATPEPVTPEAAAGTASVAAQPAYVTPFQLRPIAPSNVVRFDSALASYTDKNGVSGGHAAATMMTAGLKLGSEFGILLRKGQAANEPPGGSGAATVFTNTLLAAVYAPTPTADYRVSYSLGVTIPDGSARGDSPDLSERAALQASALARSAMDNSLFSTNYTAVIPGVDIAYFVDQWTFQAEATLFVLTRTQGAQVDADASRLNFTSGLEAGYAFKNKISAIGEVRYQQWLRNETLEHAANPAWNNVSAAVGARYAIKAGGLTLKPGIGYVFGIAGPMAKDGYSPSINQVHAWFLDLPILF